MKVQIHLTLLVACGILALGAGDSHQATDRSSIPVLTQVMVKDRTGETLWPAQLAMTARDYLHKKAPQTRTNENINISALVDCSGEQCLLSFSFWGRPGDNYYVVTLDSKGRVKDYQVKEYEGSMLKIPNLKP
jgi:hypothetical protein